MSLYDELGVTTESDATDIKRAYRAKAQRAHPDKGGGAVAFQRIQLAHDVLIDPVRRKRYDETGETKEADEAAAMLEGIARALLNLIDQVDVSTTNIMAKLRTSVEELRDSLQTGISMRQKRISARRAAAKRLTRRDGENVIAAMLEADAAKLERQNDVDRAQIAKTEQVLAMIAEYAYRTDPTQPSRSPTMQDYGALSGMFGNVWR